MIPLMEKSKQGVTISSSANSTCKTHPFCLNIGSYDSNGISFHFYCYYDPLQFLQKREFDKHQFDENNYPHLCMKDKDLKTMDNKFIAFANVTIFNESIVIQQINSSKNFMFHNIERLRNSYKIHMYYINTI